jgi:hypothetical protein
MKKVILLALLTPLPAFGQIIENFESQSVANWNQSIESHWSADTASSLSGNYSLHHIFDNPDAGIDRIGIRTDNLHPSDGTTKWSFLVRYGYAPSSLNNWSAFLMSDAAPSSMGTDGGTNGFAIGVNLTGSDDSLRLWKIKGTVISSVVNCRINWQNDIGENDGVRIAVERSKEGLWSSSVYRLDGSLITSNSGSDIELFNSSWFGILYRYSSTKDKLLWLDDINIEGSFYKDISSPEIVKCEASGKNSILISLNEEPASDFIIPGNFSLNSTQNKAVSVKKLSGVEYQIQFNDEVINMKENNLIINNICDQSGNCAQNVIVKFIPVFTLIGDVIIS